MNIIDIKEKTEQKLLLKFGKNRDLWRVLDIDEDSNTMLIISARCVAQKAFDETYKDVESTWDNSLIRKWLNEEFFESYFSEAEKELICDTTLIVKHNDKKDTSGGSDTIDKVFLLDMDEASRLFSDDRDRFCGGSWWLRSNGSAPYNQHDYVATGYKSYGGDAVYKEKGIRPATRIRFDERYHYDFKLQADCGFEDCAIVEDKKLVGMSLVPEHLSIPEGIEELEEGLFSGEKYLKSVVLPSSLLKLGNCAFMDSGIEEIHIQEGLETIPEGCFKSTYCLKSVYLPKTLKRIEKDAFSMSKIEEILIPNNTVYIGEMAFYATNIKSLEIYNPDIEIDCEAFDSCKQLKNVVLPDGLKKIEKTAFSCCWKLRIVIPDSVRQITERYDWDSCFKGIDEVTLFDGKLPNWNEADLQKKYDSVPFEGTKLKIVGQDGHFGMIYIDYDQDEPIAVQKELNKSIRSAEGYFDFETYDSIFESLKKIPSKAVMSSYRYLYPYRLSDEAKTMYEKWLKKHAEKVGRYWIDKKERKIIAGLYEKGVFDDKTFNSLLAYAKGKDESGIVKALAKLRSSEDGVHESVVDSSKIKKWIKNYTDSHREQAAKDQSFVIQDGVLIEFEGSSKTAIIPEGVKKIGDRAFFGNETIREIILPEGVVEIGKEAFCNCKCLETLIIPDTVKTVKSSYDFTHNVFKRCFKLKILILPQVFAKSIGDDIEYAFDMNSRHYYGNNLTMLVLPNAIYSDLMMSV